MLFFQFVRPVLPRDYEQNLSVQPGGEDADRFKHFRQMLARVLPCREQKDVTGDRKPKE